MKKEDFGIIRAYAKREDIEEWSVSDKTEDEAFFDLSQSYIRINGIATHLKVEDISDITLEKGDGITPTFLDLAFPQGYIRVGSSGIEIFQIICNGRIRLFTKESARDAVEAYGYAKQIGQDINEDRLIIRDNALLLYTGLYESEEIEISMGIEIIGRSAFSQTSVKKVVLPEGVKEIGDYCFMSCWELMDINLPNSLEKTGYFLFHNCVKLQASRIENGSKLFLSEKSTWEKLAIDRFDAIK